MTRYRVVAVQGERRTPKGECRSIVLCQPLTGRMHQIRAHLAARGWPIVGDPVYGPDAARESHACAPGIADAGIDRQALHAWRISLIHPVTRTPLVVTAPIPDDMQALMERVGLSMPLH